MNFRCPQCQTVYRIDPERVAPAGVRARCARCGAVVWISRDGSEATGAPTPSPAPSPRPASAPSPPPSPPPPAGRFGAQDPHARAQRLARALVSDIVAYHPARRDASLRAGTLRTEFQEEIRKSWAEYVEQVGSELARSTPYFRDALNEILAKGQKVF